MAKQFSVFGLLSGVMFCFLLFASYTSESPEIEVDIKDITIPQTINSVFSDKTYYWADEAMPNTFDAKERLDRELSVNAYWQSNTLLNIKKANRYFPMMRSILKEEGVPEDFAYLAVAESDLRNVTSYANARGFWQFRKLAAEEWGLEVNSEVDERYHVEKATRAACKYLKQLRNRFGTWTNAAAAYNVGPTNFASLQREQGETSFYDMNVNEETSRYIFRLIAIKEIISRPETFGFCLEPVDLYNPLDNYYEMKIDKTVSNWSNFAKEYGITYRMLKIYNPWLIDNKLTVNKNTYYVKIPK